MVLDKTQVDNALADFKDGWARKDLWYALAQEDLRQRFRRTIVGSLWLLLSFGAFCLAKILVFGTISNVPIDYFAVFVVIGFLCWQFINSIVVDGGSVFFASGPWMKGVALPLSTYVFQAITRIVITTLYAAAAAIPIVLWYGFPTGWYWLTLPFAVLIYLINAVWVQALLGTLCARYRDVFHLTQTIMRIIFFLTPIIWVPSQLKEYAVYAYWNPFTHFIEIIRAPLIDGLIPFGSWAVVLAITLAGTVISLIVFAYARTRIVFWI